MQDKQENAEEIAIILQNFNTKDRSVNFSAEDVKILKTLIDKYKNILICKKTDGTSIKQKEEVWNKISLEFNAMAKTPRSIKQLKYKFENMKRSAKKEASRERQELRRTGGGKPPCLGPISQEATDWLSSMMSVSINGNPSLYDDDVLTEQLSSVQNLDHNYVGDYQKTTEVENIDHNTGGSLQTLKEPNIDDTFSIEVPLFDCSTPHSSLKRPLAAPLKKQIEKKQATSNAVKRALREQKISILREINGIELEKIKQQISNEKELHVQKVKHNEEKHKLEIIKLQLEIESLKEKK